MNRRKAASSLLCPHFPVVFSFRRVWYQPSSRVAMQNSGQRNLVSYDNETTMSTTFLRLVSLQDNFCASVTQHLNRTKNISLSLFHFLAPAPALPPSSAQQGRARQKEAWFASVSGDDDTEPPLPSPSLPSPPSPPLSIPSSVVSCTEGMLLPPSYPFSSSVVLRLAPPAPVLSSQRAAPPAFFFPFQRLALRGCSSSISLSASLSSISTECFRFFFAPEAPEALTTPLVSSVPVPHTAFAAAALRLSWTGVAPTSFRGVVCLDDSRLWCFLPPLSFSLSWT